MPFPETAIRPDGSDTLIACHIQPGASRSAVLGEYDGRIKIAIQSPPVDGKANAAVRDFFKKALKISNSRVELVRGQTDRRKVIRIIGMGAAEVQDCLEKLL
ncbi:MAG: YggU family protein [Lentisphaeria bacterium]|nr:YggU family protein [Lentisphaeria bacterium]